MTVINETHADWVARKLFLSVSLAYFKNNSELFAKKNARLGALMLCEGEKMVAEHEATKPEGLGT